jgi:hypothetical protein
MVMVALCGIYGLGERKHCMIPEDKCTYCIM